MSPSLVDISRQLSQRVDALSFAAPVTHVYNPLRYARAPHERYLARFGRGPKQVILLGMNPGPWGMAQTGVPFGDPAVVRDWFGFHDPVGRPRQEHPRRPVLGVDSPRSEVSGSRLWGWARQAFGTPDAFFERFFVSNYCPLSFMEASGRNRTPDKLPRAEREALFAPCDEALRQVVALLRPRWVIGIGAFAERKVRAVCGDMGIRSGRILHPSPASPLANKGWASRAEADLRRLGIEIYSRRVSSSMAVSADSLE